jgi:hypothetical protein
MWTRTLFDGFYEKEPPEEERHKRGVNKKSLLLPHQEQQEKGITAFRPWRDGTTNSTSEAAQTAN